mmetsp:Transcript_23008/g.52772  ORF Transcript_23008/g.52772 Transcript_23008/m.52772 type:complete len:83 (+) Transcript_23008:1784-2032(+)
MKRRLAMDYASMVVAEVSCLARHLRGRNGKHVAVCATQAGTRSAVVGAKLVATASATNARSGRWLKERTKMAGPTRPAVGHA